MLDHIVNNGETQKSESLNVFAGGKGLNQSVALAKAGSLVYHAGLIGKGGEFLLDTLNENGVDTSLMKCVDETSGHAIIQVTNSGDNSIFLYGGSNQMIEKDYVDFVFSHFTKGDYCVLQNEINNLSYIVEKAYEKNMIIVFNPSPYNEIIDNIDLNMISYLVLNEIEIGQITKKDEINSAIEFLKTKYPSLKIMLTLGKKGCIYIDGKKAVSHSAFKVKAVDTTAAGDTFTGYFISYISRGENVEKTLRLSTLASAISVTKNGATPSIPLEKEVLDLVGAYEIYEIDLKKEFLKDKISLYINDNISQASLEELSKILGYTSVYTGKIIKDIYQMTFKEMLLSKRLSFAKKLLGETKISVSEIITKLGYENESFFRRKFKEKYGVTPLKYRKNGDV